MAFLSRFNDQVSVLEVVRYEILLCSISLCLQVQRYPDFSWLQRSHEDLKLFITLIITELLTSPKNLLFSVE